MNKLLISAAVAALTFGLVAPANAQVKLDLGGHFKGYGAYVDQDEPGNIADANAAVAGVNEGVEVRSIDILRETEIHFTGETTLDNGLTVGFHAEADIDGGAADQFNTEEAYAYFSGAWGRVNFGKEDGAAYLLQVAAPSADSNVDGIRQYINPVNYANIGNTAGQFGGATPATNVLLQNLVNGLALDTIINDIDGSNTGTANDIRIGASGANRNLTGTVFDYDHAVSGTSNKFTYLTPVFNGFQAGFSYTPELSAVSRGIAGNSIDDQGAGNYGDVWDVAARYEGQFGEVGLALGAGYTHAEQEDNSAVVAPVFYRDVNNNGTFNAGVDGVVGSLDDRAAWNVGVDLNWGPFGLGAVYMEDDNGVSGDALETETWAVGIDYTTGPFKLGASYLNQDQAVASNEVETDRYTGGVTYTYGPGMSFRGSISFIDHDENTGFQNSSADATSVLLGTQIDF
ncbi:MAG: porin [Alphaproteobacteria bacterium]|nr:porin [Alphaproteobacteria bacterium]MBU0860244.1 porin [Alphaproteobacteria bacterium]